MPKFFLIVFSLLLTLGATNALAQQVQWACEVLDCSETYALDDYSGKRALGEPNVYQTRPRGSSNCYLLGWREKEDDERPGTAFLKVRMCNPQKINQVAVVENTNPGALTAIYLYDESGKEYKVWTGTAGNIQAPKRVLQVTIPFTAFEVHAVKIEGQPTATAGWNGIDGIGIAESVNPIEVEVEVENLGPQINTEYLELGPRVSPDGKTLYWVVEGHPDNIGIDRLADDEDIWYSTLDKDGQWTAAQNIGKPWNNSSYNWLIGITPDGNTAIVSGRYNVDGSSGGQGVSISQRTSNGWSVPKPVTITNYENTANMSDWFLSNDKRILLQSSSRQKGKPDKITNMDLFVSIHQGKNVFSEPVSLGSTINTNKMESAPFLASDGVTLYFSSDGHGGLGDNDIFMAKRLDETWQKWSEPVNLGAPINSDDYDSDFSISAQGDYAYLVRYVDTYGKADVFRVKLASEARPNPVVLISGRVLNKKTKEPIGAEIIYEQLPEGAEVGRAASSQQNGRYKIILPYGHRYGFMASAAGYYAITENLDVSDLTEYKEIERDLYLAPLEIGETILLNNIFFESGKSTLLPESFPELNRVVSMLRSNSGLQIQLAGHTDNVGSDEANLKLSQNRAQAVVDYIAFKGIASSQLIAKGYGETAPVGSNDTDSGRARNRRVEFKVLKK